MSPAALSFKDRYTYQDYLSWDDGERWELIEGVAYNMSPAPNRKHQRLVHELGRVIGNELVGKTCEVNIAPFDVRLPN
ncbi:MAG: Uma2 family endonuclease, partial [Bacteroidota bacterium]